MENIIYTTNVLIFITPFRYIRIYESLNFIDAYLF